MTPLERFERKYIPVTESGCWIWLGGLQGKGYGQFTLKNKRVKAHRFSFEQFVGEIPDGMLVCHHCDVMCCVNPAHLFVGTNSDNMSDCANKGRLHIQKRPDQHPNTRKKYCKNGHQLTAENTAVRSDNGGRRCKICDRIRVRP
jgi:hypothetical protein